MGLLNDDHIYSYSQLQSMSECPYGFYLERIEKADQLSNGFAEQGSLIHDIIDKWAKGKLTKEEMVTEYQLRYPDEVVTQFPRMLAAKGYATKAYELGVNYFKNFDEFKGYHIIDTESKFETDLEGRRFMGIVDMVMEDESTGEFIVLDHKSKSLSAFKKAEDEMYRQQYMYSKYIYEKFGRYPDKLMFNLFKENGIKMSREFNLNEYNKTIDWAIDQITKIETYDVLDFMQSKEQDFFCTEICSVRRSCPNGSKQQTEKKKRAPRKKNDT